MVNLMRERIITSSTCVFLVCLAAMTGCASHSTRVAAGGMLSADYYRTVGLTPPMTVQAVMAQCVPPEGWKPEPLKQSERHTHQVWLSPTGRTAYGVIHFKLPLPVGVNIVYWEFLRELKKKEGTATELSRESDPALPGLRFVCEGGRYKMRVNLIVDGFDGWAVYAGTLREFAEIPAELILAERARENTIIGLPPERQASVTGE
jgi:hypothetical protein